MTPRTRLPRLASILHSWTGRLLVLVLATTTIASCAGEPGAPEETTTTDAADERPAPNPDRNPYFGDLHVHTRYSFDAYIFSVRANPDDAYRFAKGEAIPHPSGHQIQLQSGPLDFQAVTDHDLYLGTLPQMDDPESALYDTQFARELRELGPGNGFQRAITALRSSGEFAALDQGAVEAAARTAWSAIVEAAEQHNDPGRFTTFVAYEYTATSGADRGNLHRNVVFRGAAPDLPYTSVTSHDPETLWDWLDGLRADGIEGLAIPHNSNGSNGHMFQLSRFDGSPLDAEYAEQRMRNEPLVEVTQVKGDSETHPMLSPNDEWADFEVFPYRIATSLYSEPSGGYAREAYLNGIALEATEGYNPFKFGLIGSTDTHNAAGTPEEDNYHSKVGSRDGTPQLRGSVPLDEPGPDDEPQYTDGYFHLWAAAGLAGVWAEENTREAIYDGFRRKETFATTGPRIPVRLFASFDFTDDLLDDPEMISRAYESGVPMGGDLIASGEEAPRFLVWAARDANSAPLQRLQVVKGWLEDGETREAVIDVACSDGLEPDPETRRCPDNGASVDLSDCSISEGLGAGELKTLWTDPDWDPSQRAFYYLRVLENPTCRWSTWDALRAGVEPREGIPATLQERAYSSPIWVSPSQ